MGARHKLNAAYFNGCLLLSAVLGAAAQSWAVFLGALAVSLALGVHAGDIRTRPDRR
jgi:hypothetical protein